MFQIAFTHCSVWRVALVVLWAWDVCGCSALLGHGGRAAGKGQGDTGPILEGEKSNSILDLFFYVSEKKIKSTL